MKGGRGRDINEETMKGSDNEKELMKEMVYEKTR
jgi:hypothetical protein